jgi:23S rRNA (guanosine2251-2'-O)-methyltransferase
MTRKRDRRPSPPSSTSREPPLGAGGRTRTQAAEPGQALARAPRDRPGERSEAKVSLIYGFHSVAAALKAPRRELIRLYATAAAAERLSGEIAARGLETRIMTPEDISARSPREAVHQGLLLEARPLAPIDIAELPANGLVLVLDQITDPHNVGAILRTGAAFAVDALVTTERHSPDFAGALAKSASGGLEHVPICSVPNLARALADLGDMGYWRIGLDSEATNQLTDETLTRPLALVFGAEGKGLRRLTRERCDRLARLDLPGAIKSLNVSSACAIALALVHERISVQA